jgi:hypothetical protein
MTDSDEEPLPPLSPLVEESVAVALDLDFCFHFTAPVNKIHVLSCFPNIMHLIT